MVTNQFKNSVVFLDFGDNQASGTKLLKAVSRTIFSNFELLFFLYIDLQRKKVLIS